MLDQEYSSPGPEYSRPGTELAPAGRAFAPGEGEYFPEVPELAEATENTRVSPPMPSWRKRRRRGAGRGVLRQAAAAMAIGAVTVAAVASVSGTSLGGFGAGRGPEYISAELTDEQRDYLDRAFNVMESRDDMAAQLLMQEEGDMFDAIYRDVVHPLAQELSDRNGGAERPDELVGYDGTGLFSLWGDNQATPAYITLMLVNTGESTQRGIFFNGNETHLYADFFDESHDHFLWLLYSFKDSAGSGSEILERFYYDTYAAEARLTGVFADLRTADGRYSIRALQDGTAQYRVGTFLNADAAVGTAEVEDFVTVRYENMDFSPREQDGYLFVDVVLEQYGTVNRIYTLPDLIAPQQPNDYAYTMLASGAPANQFGYYEKLNQAPEGPGGGQEPAGADVGYVYTDFTDGQRAYLDQLLSAVRSGRDEAVEDLLMYDDGMFAQIAEILSDCGNQVGGRLRAADANASPADLVGYDGTGVFSVLEYPNAGAYITLKSLQGAQWERILLYENGDDDFTSAVLRAEFSDPENRSGSFEWHHNLTIKNCEYENQRDRARIADGAFIRREYDPLVYASTEAAIIGELELLNEYYDTEYSVWVQSLRLVNGTARFSSGPYTSPVDRTYAATATVSAQNGQLISDGTVRFDTGVDENGSAYVYREVLTDAHGNEYAVRFSLIDEVVESTPGETLSGKAGDNITWTLTPGGLLTLTGAGDMYDYGNGNYSGQAPWAAHTSGVDVTALVLGDGITHLGKNAFRELDYLTSVDIPDSVRSIGDSCFIDNARLSAVTLPEGLEYMGMSAFSLCPELHTITIPDSVTETGSIILSDCEGLTDAYLSGGIKNLPTGIFKNCTALQNVTLGEGIEIFGSCIFQNCSSLTRVDLPESTRILGMEIFQDCTSLTDVYIPAGIEREIPDNVFVGAAALSDIWFGGTEDQWAAVAPELPDTVTVHYNSPRPAAQTAGPALSGQAGDNVTWTLTQDGLLTFTGAGAINNYTSTNAPWNPRNTDIAVTRLVVGEGITKIGNSVLQGLFYLTSAELPSTLTSIGTYTFADCSALADINFPEGLQGIGTEAFRNCVSLPSVVLPDGLTTLGSYAFEACTGLKSAVLPGSLGDLNDGIFNRCEGLASVTMKEGITSIASYTFNHCLSLTDVAVPEGVTSIDATAFTGSGVRNLTLPASVTGFDPGSSTVMNSLTDLYYTGTEAQYRAVWGDPADGFYGATVHIGQSGPGGGASDAAASGQAGDNITWTLTRDGVLTFTGSGAMYDYTDAASIPWTAVSSGIDVTEIHLGDGITRVGNRSFLQLGKLTSVELPGTLTEIGDAAFAGCNALESLTFPEGLQVIGSSAFNLCSSLQAAVLPESLTELGSNAFGYCTSLTTVTVPGVSALYGQTFNGCTALSGVTLGAGIQSLARWDFASCSALRELVLPEGLKSVAIQTFDGSGITTLTLPASIEIFNDRIDTLTDVYYNGTEEQFRTFWGDPAEGFLGAAVHIMG